MVASSAFDKLYHVLLRLFVGVVFQVLYVFPTPCQVMVELLLQIFVQASCHGRFESGPGLGFTQNLTHFKSGLELGLACALTILRYDANMKGITAILCLQWLPSRARLKNRLAQGLSQQRKVYGANTTAERPVKRCPVDTSAGPWRSNTSSSLSTETAKKGRSYKKILAGVDQILYGFHKTQRSG